MEDQAQRVVRAPQRARWAEVPRPREVRAHGHLARLLGPLAVASLLWLLGLRALAAVVAVLGTTVGVLAACWPAFARVLARVAAAISHAVGTVLSTLLLGAVGLAVVPVALLLRVVRRDPLVLEGDSGRWARRAGSERSLPERTFSAERDPLRQTERPLWRFVQVTVTAAVLLLALDLAAGWAWDRTVGNVDDGPRLSDPSGQALGAAPTPPAERLTDTSARADLPAMADAPWAEQFFYELDTMPSRFDPFLVNLAYPYDGAHITTTELGRVSYQAADLPDDAPVVWFFGGSTMFGEAQRDQHTIPSEVSRLAEDAGVPIRVQNYGQRGWVVWQELLRFEQELAARAAPDVAVFYDGTNDVNVQAEQGGGQPTVYNAQQYREAMEGIRLEDDGSGDVVVVPDRSLQGQLFDWWGDTSLIAELARQVQEVLSVAPAAAGDDEWDLTPEEERAVVSDAVEVYRRARTLVLELSDQHEVEPLLFWQPELATTDPSNPRAEAADLVGPPTIDLTDVLSGVDPDSVYIDGGHTNELGARLVAEAMWEHLEPLVQQAYEDERDAG